MKYYIAFSLHFVYKSSRTAQEEPMSGFKHEVPLGETGALVGVIMGSQSDWPTMRAACETLDKLGIPWGRRIISAHRTPHRLREYAETAKGRGLKIIIAGAGGAAHLPGMVAAYTRLPVHGVPVESAILKGQDSLLSIVQMPSGVPVATFAIGKAGAVNAALEAARILALMDPELDQRLATFIQQQTDSVQEIPVDQ